MSEVNELDELFLQMKEVERTDAAKRNTFQKLKEKTTKKTRFSAPLVVTIAVIAIVSILTFNVLKPDTTSPDTATVVTNDDKNKEAVTAVLQSEFTVPNEEYIRIQQNLDTKIDEMLQELPENSEGINLTEDIPEVADYQELVEKTYKQYYTTNEFEKLIPTNQAFRYHIWTSKKDVHYKMNISDIHVMQSDNENTPKNYDFNAQVEYTNNAGKTSLHHIKGMAILSEEGKIGKFTIRDDGGIQEKINEDTMQ